MLGLIIFDHLNDVIFSHGDTDFEEHIKKIASSNGLFYPAWTESVPETRSERCDVLVQLFSPFLASQRIMGLEFHNPYHSIRCDNGLEMIFSEYLSYQCLCLAQNANILAEKFISVSVSLAKLICGPVLSRLKSDDGTLPRHLAKMLDSYVHLQHHNQAYHVEAIERLIVGDDVQNKVVSVLQRTVSRLPNGGQSHAFLTVDNTLVSLYSGRQVAELSPSDLLQLMLLVSALKPDVTSSTQHPSDGEETASLVAGSMGTQDSLDPSTVVREVLCFLHANRSPLAPHLVYVINLWQRMDLVIVCDLCVTEVSGGLHESIESVAKCHQAVTIAQRCQIYGHLKHGLAVLFSCVKHFGRSGEVKQLVGRLKGQWDQLRRLKVDSALCGGEQLPPAVEQGMNALSRTLEATFEAVCHALPERGAVSTATLLELLDQAQGDLDHYRSFLFARAVTNATMESRSHLTVSRYLDTFPDLVHFIYVDRCTHLMTAPSPCPVDGRHDLTQTVWDMIELANRYLFEGHMSIIWRDDKFSYAHFLWFEDPMGNPMKASETPKKLKALSSSLRPGIIVRDYCRALISVCFPDEPPEDVRCYELFLIHRGPVQSARVLEQSQKIAKTVWEVSGAAAAPLDLL